MKCPVCKNNLAEMKRTLNKLTFVHTTHWCDKCGIEFNSDMIQINNFDFSER